MYLVVGFELEVLEHALVPALLPPLKVLQPDKAQGTIQSDFILLLGWIQLENTMCAEIHLNPFD